MPPFIHTNPQPVSPSLPAEDTTPGDIPAATQPLSPRPAAVTTSGFSSFPMYSRASRPKMMSADAPATGSSANPASNTEALAHLQQSQQQYDKLTDGQPSFFTFTRDWLSKRLQSDFSVSTIDLYVNRYAIMNGQRRLLSSRPLLSVFREAIAGGSLPSFDKDAVDVSARAQTGADSKPLPEFHSQPALDKLERALREGAKDFPDLFRREEANYWSGLPSSGVTKSRKQLLAAEMANALRTESELRHRDGTLDDTSHRMVVTFANRYADPPSKNTGTDAAAQIYTPYLTYPASTVGTRTIHIPGALVLTQRPIAAKKTPDGTQIEAGKMVLLVPGQGIKSFDNESSLSRTLIRQFAPDASVSATANYVRGSDDAMARRVQDLLNAKDEQWRQAFYGARGKPLTNGGTTTFGQILDRASSVAPSVDTQSIIDERNAASISQAMPDWLRNAEPKKKQAWSDANRMYLKALRHTSPLDAKSLGNAKLVRAYARYRLSETLKWEHGSNRDPDNINITRTWRESTTGGDPNFKTFHVRSETKTLTELSLTNISWFDQFTLPGSGYTVTDPKKRPIFGFDFKKVRDIVQSADVGGSYDEALKRLVTDKGRRDYAEVLQSAMRAQLLESQMRDLVTDGGTKLVKIALDHPDPAMRAKLRGGSVTVSQWLIGGATVNGVKLFEANPLNNGPLILYMPDAPDGKIFREYADRASMWSDLQSSARMRIYLAQRVGKNDTGNITRILAAKGRASVQASLITGNFLKRSFDADVAFARANADAQTVSNKEIRLRDVKDGILLTYDIASTFLPVKITLPLALARSIHSAWDAGQALRQGNRNEALAHATEALMTLAFDALGEVTAYRSIRHASPPTLSKGSDNLVTLRMDSVPATRSLPDPALRAFEQKNLNVTTLKAGADDVYVQPGKNEEYVEIDGKWYASAEDGGRRFVYMPGEEGPSATWPIHRSSNQWQFTAPDELPGRPIPSSARIPERYRVTPPADLSAADSLGISRSQGQEYIKIDEWLYRSAQGGHGRYIYDGNPSHRIAVRRNAHHWEVTPPSFGLGGQRSGPIKIIQDIYNMNASEARAFLDRYQFPANGPYTEHNFALAIAYTDEIPAWADQFKRSPALSPDAGSAAGADGSSRPALAPKSDQVDDDLPDFARIHEGSSPASSPGNAKPVEAIDEPDFPIDPDELAGKLDRAPQAQAARRIVSRDEPDGSSISTTYGNLGTRSTFVADYQPGIWSFHDLFRHASLQGVHASDIIREQYRKVSMYQDFFGRLPSKLKFTNLQNLEAKNLIHSHIGRDAKPGTYEAGAILQAFMTTELGKIVPRIANDFDLEPYDMKIIVTDNRKLITELSVKPKSFKD